MAWLANTISPTIHRSIYRINKGGVKPPLLLTKTQKGKQMNGNFARTAIRTKKVNVRPKLTFGGKRF